MKQLTLEEIYTFKSLARNSPDYGKDRKRVFIVVTAINTVNWAIDQQLDLTTVQEIINSGVHVKITGRKGR